MNNTYEVRWIQRLHNFKKVLTQLEMACLKDGYSDLERAGLVLMFAFSFELAWKTYKDLLIYEGYDSKTPRSVIRTAHEAGYVNEEDAEVWLDALRKRNLLSHTYEEETAKEAESLINNIYAPLLRRIYDVLERKSGS